MPVKELYVLGNLYLDLESPDETKEHALERLVMKCMREGISISINRSEIRWTED